MANEKLELTIQVDASGANAEIMSVNSALGRMGTTAAAQGGKASAGIDRMAYSSREANHALQGMGEQLGLRIPRYITSFISNLNGVGPALSAAFSTVAIAGAAYIAGEALARIAVGVVNLKSTLSDLGHEWENVWGVISGKGNLEFRGENINAASKLMGERILKSQERVEQLKRATAALGLGPASAIKNEQANAIADLRKRFMETEKLPWSTATAELAAIDAKAKKALAIEADKESAEWKKRILELDERTLKVNREILEVASRARLSPAENLDLFNRTKAVAAEAEEVKALIALRADAAHSLRENAAADQQQMVMIADQQQAAAERAAREAEANYKHTFSTLKSEAGGVFDALLQKSTNVFAAIGNAFKVAILSAIKDIVTSRVARALMGMGFGGGGGVAGELSGGSLGAAAAIPALAGLSGGPGGTGGFAGAVGGGGHLSMGSLLSGLGGIAGLGAAVAGGGLLAAPAIGSKVGGSLGGAITGAGLAAGGIATAGLLTGFGYATSLASFFGPVGLAVVGIAAGIGALAAWLHKSAADKARQKIKSTYGVDIHDKGILQQIVETAKQSFGGNLDVAIQSPGVRDLIQLYGMSTGQRGNIPAGMHSSSFAQNGGGLFSVPSYVNGSASGSLDMISPGRASNAGTLTVPVSLTLDGKVLDQRTIQVVTSNGRAVSAAVVSGAKASAGRRELTALQVSPGTLVS